MRRDPDAKPYSNEKEGAFYTYKNKGWGDSTFIAFEVLYFTFAITFLLYKIFECLIWNCWVPDSSCKAYCRIFKILKTSSWRMTISWWRSISKSTRLTNIYFFARFAPFQQLHWINQLCCTMFIIGNWRKLSLTLRFRLTFQVGTKT